MNIKTVKKAFTDIKGILCDFFNKNTYLKLLCLNTILLLVCIFILPFHYETNDDPGIVGSIMGVNGVMDYHVMFMNAYLAKAIQGIFSVSPLFNWYTLILVLLAYASVSAILYVLVQKREDLGVLFPYVTALVIFIAPCYYTVLQFTRVAGICVAAGFLLMLTVIEKGAKKSLTTGLYLISIILVLLGSMVRTQMLLGVGFIFAPAFIIVFIRSIKKYMKAAADDKKTIRTDILCFVAAVCITGISCIGMYALDKNSYTGPEYAEWVESEDAQTELMDFGWPDYEENRDFYMSIGITDNSFTNYILHDYDDPNYINIDSFRKIIEKKEYTVLGMKSIFDIDWDSTSYNLMKIFTGLYRYSFFWLCLPVVLYVLTVKGKRLYPLLYIVMLTGTETVFAVMKRGLRARVDISLLLSVMLLCAFMLDCSKDSDTAEDEAKPNSTAAGNVKSKIYLSFYAVCILVYVIGFGKEQVKRVDYEKGLTTKQYLYNLACEDKAHIYIRPVLDSVPLSFDMWSVKEFGHSDNFFPMGGTPTSSPVRKRQMELRGIKNFYTDLVDRDDVYLFTTDSDVELKVQYIREHYFPEAVAVPVKRMYGVTMYKFFSSDANCFSKERISGFVNVKDIEARGINVDCTCDIGDSEDYPGKKSILGTIIADGVDSYNQEIILKINDVNGVEHYYQTIQIVNDDYVDGEMYRYSRFLCEPGRDSDAELDFDSIEIMYKNIDL